MQTDAVLNEDRRQILSISGTTEDHGELRTILNDPRWQITEACSCKQAIRCLCWDRMAVIICDCHLNDGTWRDILSHTAELMDPPLIIVTSKAADEQLWAEVLNLGGYDVLSKPFHPTEVKHVLTSAWRQRSSIAARVQAVGAA